MTEAEPFSPSERRMRALVDHLPSLIAYIDNDQRYQFANARFAASFNAEPQSFIGRTMREVLGEALHSKLQPHIEAALRGEPVKFDRHTTELGGDAYHSVEYIPNVSADGRVDGFFAMVLDITARRQSELMQARSEERLRGILTNAPDAFVAANAAGAITDWNRQAEAVFGWSREEAVGMPLADLLPADRAKGARVSQVNSFGSRVETVAVRKDGSSVPVELSVAAVQDQRGFSTIAFLHDISARQAAEAALKETQDSLAITGRLAGVGGWQLDLQSNVMHSTDEVREIHEVAEGFNPTLVQALDFIDVGAQTALISLLQDGIHTGNRWQIEVPLVSAKGHRRWVRIVGDTLFDAEGEPLRVVGALQDITSQKTLEQRLATQESFIRSVTNNLSVRIGYVDREGRYQFINDAYCKRFGQSREEILGRTRAELLGATEDAKIAPFRERALGGELQRFEAEETVKGEVRCVETQLVPDFDEHGAVRGLFKTGVDITERKSAEAALRELTEIFDNTSDFIVQSDRMGRLTYMNPAVRRALGFDVAEDLSRHAFNEFYTPSTNRQLVEVAGPAAAAHGVWLGESAAIVKGGQVVPVSHMVLAHRDDAGRVSRYSSVMRDISGEVQARDLIYRQTQTLTSIAEAIPAAVAVLAPDLTYRYVNSAFERWRSAPRSEIIGKSIRELLGESEYAKLGSKIERVTAGETVTFERDSAHGGLLRHQLVTYVPLRLVSGELDGFVGVAQDITEHRQEELRLQELSERDPLTGVLNRQGLESYLEQRQGHTSEGLALLYIDLDRFKPVNDTYGHPVGDALLKAFAERLQKLVRPTDLVARLGGDEFAIVLLGIRSQDNADVIADKVVAAAAQPFHVGQLVLSIGASVGVAMAADDGWDGLVRRADAAVYRAKVLGRGRRV